MYLLCTIYPNQNKYIVNTDNPLIVMSTFKKSSSSKIYLIIDISNKRLHEAEAVICIVVHHFHYPT